MISYILFFLAGLVNSLLDTLTFREDRSIFDKHDWSPFQTHNKEKKFLGIVQFDAWHLFKYLFLGLLMFSVNLNKTPFGILGLSILGLCWFIGFELGWKLFTKK